MSRLEQRDSLERAQDVPHERRLRQITPEVGRFLHTLVLATKPRSILELGTSGGYSTIWLATAARQVGTVVVTVEIDPAKVRQAAENFREAGVDGVVTSIEGDAFTYLRARTEPVDFLFMDAEKGDYLSYLPLIVSLLSHGGVLVADNLLSHAELLQEFRERVLSHPELSAIVVPVGRGELFAVKIA